MKIFFNIKNLSKPGGVERATVVLANELIARGYDVGIICMEKDTVFFETHPQVRLYYLYDMKDKRPSLVRDISRRKHLKSIYRQEAPDIIIIVGSGRSMLYLPTAKKISTITWEHYNANWNWHLMHRLSRKLAAKYSDSIVVLTQQDKESYESKFKARNVVCIPNPVTIDNGERSPLTERIVLATGHFIKRKGFDKLIDAWSGTRCKGNGWKLRIVGSGELESVLSQKIEYYGLHGSVELIPPVKDMVSLYKQASLFVMSSLREGLPLVMIEAMAMGLPIVSFDCETGPRDIIDDGVTGLLVPTGDAGSLARAIDELICDNDRRTLFSKNSVERAKLFDMEKILVKWEALFRELKKD